ncbi:sterol regulatory element binding protein cleavage-activating protein [Phlegmacium glaucopus]|nr:sterol regulatory element binding protein cleavage-activating protein [Phlegmacium glaucopus]
MSLLQWARKLGQTFFLQFGLHCATHQIRVILISCIVITSLFYPALDVYTSSKNSSPAILDKFISTNTVTGITTPNDLVNLWSGHDTLHIHEDPIIHAQCREGHALRVERILIQSPLVDDDRALNHRILLSTLHLEELLEDLVSTADTPCLKGPNGRCFVISPLAFWAYNKDALLSDVNILDTLSNPDNNISVAGVPITPHMVLAGRGSYEHSGASNRLDYATFLTLTYFFPNSACWASEPQHAWWVQTVKNVVAQNAEVIVQLPEASLIALEYDLHLSEGWSAISACLYLAYIGFFAYVAWSVRRMNTVHSRLGVTFTALVEIAVSTITSLSVCALVGFKITMVPWELLPIVIAFVGAENMFNLVDAVGKTSVTLSVKQRIAEGLSRAGTSNTLKVVSYNAILGIIAFFAVGAVRQFCSFAIVVLVAHWFLAHTFFMAVLSIDIARLELEELLRHDTSLVPSVPTVPNDGQNSKQPRSRWQKLIVATQTLLKGRAATNISLLMLLAVAATLYYTTYTASTSTPNPNLIKPVGAVSRSKGRPSFDVSSTAQQIWKIMNPAQTPLLHLRVEMPTTITFHPDGESTTPKLAMQSSYRSRRTFKFVLWVLTIMVLPIAATTSALWGLLIYLLKNTELLEAQRNCPEAEASAKAQDDEKSLEGQISFSTLPRAFASDVELIAASKDGRVIVSVGLHNEITIWNAETKKHIAIDATNVLLGMASTSSCAASTVMCVTVDDRGRHFAVGTGSGLIAVWSIDPPTGIVELLPTLSLENSSRGVTEIYFIPSIPFRLKKAPGRTRSTSEPDGTSEGAILLATYESGVATRWSVSDSTLSYFVPSREAVVIRSSLLHVIPDDRVLFAFCLDDGSVEVIETGDFEPTILQECCIRPGNAFDVAWKVHACRAEMDGSVRFVIVAATESGSVSLWDGMTGECISILEETHGRINHLRVSPVKCETCHFCGQLPMESLSVAFSIDHVIRFSKLYLDDQNRRCSCTRNHSLQQQQQSSHMRRVSSRESLLGRRSRSNSNASSPQVSPLIPRARLATAFETSAFPVSGHGVHSRRASEKDTGRRSSELLIVPFPSNPAEEYELHSPNGHRHDHNGSTTSTNQRQSIWRNAIMVRLIDVTCERGGWDLTSRKFVGIRRKPRSQGKPKAGTTWAAVSPSIGTSSSSHGLTSATLERWELWTFDPALTLLKSSLLAALALRPGDTEGRLCSSFRSPTSTPSSLRTNLTSSTSSSGERIARLPFTRVSPLLIAPSHALAGFGNTVGVFHFSS